MMFQTAALPIPDPFAERSAAAALFYITLHESERPLTTDEIAEALKRPLTSVRRMAYDLATAELVERRPDPRDMRRYVYSLPAEM